MSSVASAPGPKGLDVVQTLMKRGKDPFQVMLNLRARYGPIVEVKVGDTGHFLVSDAQAARHILVENHENYPKGPGYALLGQVLGEGLVTSDGELWRRHRRVVQPVLQRDRMKGSVDIIAEAAAEGADAMEPLAARATSVDVYDLITRLALRIAARAFLGTDVREHEDDVCRALTVLFDYVQRKSASPTRALGFLPGAGLFQALGRAIGPVPTPSRRAFEGALRTVDAVMAEVVERRRRETRGQGEATDLVGRLISAGRDSAEDRLSDREIRDEIMTMFVAGHETTATAVTWCLHLLAKHPEHQHAIASEARGLMGERRVQWEDLPHLPLAQHAFEEAIRLYPPVWRISRHAIDRDRLGDFDVPAGSVVIIAPYLIHHDPAYWPHPERFDPGRFHHSVRQRTQVGAYLPFGAGQRMCPGGSFATAEAQVILSTLCRRFTFQPTTEVEPAFEPRLTLRPKGGLHLRLRLAADTPPPST